MNRQHLFLLFLCSLILFTSCEFVKNTLAYKKSAKIFAETLMNEDFDKCIELFAMEHKSAENTNVDTLKKSLHTFKNHIASNFGERLEYTFMSSEKKFSTVEGESTAPNTTKVLMQIENQETFGILELIFDDTSKKVLNINILDVKKEIPKKLFFWLFGLLALLIPIFNILVIVQIKRSNLKRKWLKYLAVICINIPTVSYSLINGLAFKLLFFQILFGVSFAYTGYLNAMWAFGIPLGGIYWLWKMRNLKEEAEISEIEIEPLSDVYNEN